jgi:hypothetical protein
MGHDDKRFGLIIRDKEKPFDVRTHVRPAAESFVMKLRVLPEIEGNEACRFSHPDVEGLLIDHAGNESCGHDKRYYNDYCDQYVFHVDIILYIGRKRQPQKAHWFCRQQMELKWN